MAAPPSLPGVEPDVHGLRGWRRLVLWPLALLVRCWCRTLRFDMAEDDRRLIEWSGQPVAFVLWHNRLFLSAEIFRRHRRRKLCALVSASSDGAWLAAFFSLMGMGTVRGSSSRFGREAVQLLTGALHGGRDIAVTPDGPRGPCYDFKKGALVVARRARAPLILFGGEFSSAWRLASWDGFYLPLPFSTVRLRFIRVDADVLAAAEEAPGKIAALLTAINPDRH